jgi:type III pantothenate kinase
MIVGDPALDLGPKPNVDRPDTVGADRLCNTVAAHERYPGAVIVVDFGTATNFDIVSESGAFDGSVIAPGANLSIEALHQAAALLPRVAIHRAQKVIGRDTVSSMQSGVYWGYVGLITGLINRIKAEYGKPMTVVATGGLAHLFHPDIPAIEHVDPDLTMRGLMLIHARNAKK